MHTVHTGYNPATIKGLCGGGVSCRTHPGSPVVCYIIYSFQRLMDKRQNLFLSKFQMATVIASSGQRGFTSNA